MVANSGRLQIIGLRAVLYDVGKYLQEGKRLEDADKRISKAMDNVALTSIRTSEKITGLQNRLAVAKTRDIKLSQEAAKAVVASEALKLAAAEKTAAAFKAIEANRLTSGALNTAGLQLGSGAQGAVAKARENQEAAIAAATASQAANTAANIADAAAIDKTEKALAAKALTTAIDTKLMNANTEAGIRNTNAQHRLAEAIQARNITPIQRLKAIAPAAAGIAAIGAGIATVASISQAAKYQDNLVKIDNLTNISTTDTEKLGKAILEMTKTIPKSADDLSAGAYELLSRDVGTATETIEILEQVAKASVGGFTDIKEVAVATAAIMNAYGKENINAKQTLDILFATVKAGGGDFKDYATDIGRVVQLARGLGVTFDQVGAGIAVLTNVGLTPSQSVTALLGILNQIASPSKEAEEALLSVGSSVDRLQVSIRDKGLLPTLQETISLFDKQGRAIETLFPEVRGYSGALALLAGDQAKFNRAQDITANSVGTVEDAFNKARKNLNNVATLLRNTLSRVLIELGTRALPAVTKAFEDLNIWINKNKEGIVSLITTGVTVLIFQLRAILSLTGAVVDVLSGIYSVINDLNIIVPLAAVAMANFGKAMIWALPGGPYIKGLLIIAGIFETLKSDPVQDFIDKTNKSLGIKTGDINISQDKIKAELSKGGTIDSVIKELAGGMPGVAEALIQALKEKGVDTNLGLIEFEKAIAKTDESAKRANQNLSKIPEEFRRGAEESAKLKEELAKLTEEFRKAAEAAGTVESSFDATGLFASVSKELQKALKVSDFQAGQIQGANAVTSASARAASEQSNYARIMGTMAEVSRQVAAGVQGAVGAMNQLVSALARTALETQQALADAVFARPTREVANLNLDLARNRQQNLGPTQSNDSQIRALQDKLEALNKQSERAQSAAQNTQQRQQAQVQKQQQAGQDAQRAANDDQQRASEAIADQLRIANLIARQTYERLDENFSRLIDANTQQQSTLQETFRKQNDIFSRQILEATGKGDITAALDLSKQQREASKAYKVNAASLVKTNDQLQIQQKEAGRVEAERQRQAELAEAMAKATQQQTIATETQTGAVENQTGAVNNQTDAVDKATSSIDAQKASIQSQIDSLTRQNETMDRSSTTIEDQIAAYQANTDVQKAAVVAANLTLFSEEEQAREIQKIIGNIREASGVMRTTTKNILDLLPGDVAETARKAWNEFMLGLQAATDPGLVNFNSGIDAAAVNAQLLAGTYKASSDAQIELAKQQAAAVQEASAIIHAAANETGQHLDGLGNTAIRAKSGIGPLGDASFRAATPIDTMGKRAGTAFIKLQDFARQLDTTKQGLGGWIARLIDSAGLAKPSNTGGVSLPKNAEGGFYSKPTRVMVGETYQKELILPLERPARARQLLAQIPPSLMATLRTSGGSQNVFAPNITVTGETLDAMEAATIRLIRQEFRQARATSSRQGGLLTSGLGPAALRS